MGSGEGGARSGCAVVGVGGVGGARDEARCGCVVLGVCGGEPTGGGGRGTWPARGRRRRRGWTGKGGERDVAESWWALVAEMDRGERGERRDCAVVGVGGVNGDRIRARCGHSVFGVCGGDRQGGVGGRRGRPVVGVGSWDGLWRGRRATWLRCGCRRRRRWCKVQSTTWPCCDQRLRSGPRGRVGSATWPSRGRGLLRRWRGGGRGARSGRVVVGHGGRDGQCGGGGATGLRRGRHPRRRWCKGYITMAVLR